jgi:transposase
VAAARAAWHPALAGIAPERLVFLDESGLDTRLTRTHARAPRGERARGHAPWKRRRVTLIAALGLGGVVALTTVAAATDATVFVAFIEGVLAPALKRRPEAVLVLDNLSVHKTPAVRAALDQAGISYRYLPSYSPDFNPMEPCWAKLKAHFRARAARSVEALEAELPSAWVCTCCDARALAVCVMAVGRRRAGGGRSGPPGHSGRFGRPVRWRKPARPTIQGG